MEVAEVKTFPIKILVKIVIRSGKNLDGKTKARKKENSVAWVES